MPQLETVKDVLDWAYANLAAYQVALAQGDYTKSAWMTRSKLWKGLQSGSVTPSGMYLTARKELRHAGQCVYCGSASDLTLDHLFPQKRGGSDSADNLVTACRSCNSSKGTMDYFEWMATVRRPVVPEVAERYLKNAYAICGEAGLLDANPAELCDANLPFDIMRIPQKAIPVDSAELSQKR